MRLPFLLTRDARRRHVREAVDEEFAFHLDLRTRELVARGLSPEHARAEALRQFGDVDDARDYCRHLGERKERRLMWLDRLHVIRNDLALAARSLRRAPGLTLAAALTLALGVGATAAMVRLVDDLLFRPPAGVRAPAELRRIYMVTSDEGGDTSDVGSWPVLQRMAESLGGAAGRPALAAWSSYDTGMGSGGDAEDARVVLASADYFAVLGVRPALGRTFGRAEEAPPAGARVAVLAWDAWQRRFGGGDVVGRTVDIAGERFEVIGVLPRGFAGADPERVDAWVPMSSLAPQVVGRFAPDGWERAIGLGWLRAVARLPDADATAAGAQARLSAAFRRVREEANPARAAELDPRAMLAPLLLERGPGRSPAARLSVWLAAMAVVVLAIACANVASLLLARVLRRRREHAVRVAMGAARWRLGFQAIAEALVLAVLGGAGAMLVAHWGGALVRRALLPDAAAPRLDARTAMVAGAAALVAGLLTGLVPAVQAMRGGAVAGTLRSDARSGGGRRSRTRSALVVLQASLSLVLLAGAGLFARSLQRALAVDLGYAADQVLAVDVELPLSVRSSGGAPAPANAAQAATYERLRERVAALPGVRVAALSVTEPFSTRLTYGVTLPGRDSIPMPPSGEPRVNAVSPGYFAAMGTRLVRGRAIAPTDVRGGAPVAVVNETMARFLWADGTAIGRCVVMRDFEGRPCAEVVGIARDVRWSDLQEQPTMQVYLALAQDLVRVPLRTLLVRGTGDPDALVASVRRAVGEEVPAARRVRVQPLALNLARTLRPWRLGATTLLAFGGVALALAALGLYATVAYDVGQRVREIGVRLALGARAGDVGRLVVLQGVRLAAIGVGAGLLVALAAGRWVAPLLFETAPHDAWVLGGVAALLLLVAVLAAAVPAWRASRLPPALALRIE